MAPEARPNSFKISDDFVSVRVVLVALRDEAVGFCVFFALMMAVFLNGFGMVLSFVREARIGAPTTTSPQFAGRQLPYPKRTANTGEIL